MIKPIFRTRVALLVCVVAWAQATAAQADVNPRWRPFNWHVDEVFSDFAGYAEPPDDDVRQSITVEWEEPQLDPLGHSCTLRGQVTFTPEGEAEPRAVDWFQGITLYVSRYPDFTADWSNGMNHATTFHDTCLVDNAGGIEMKVDLRQTVYDSEAGSSFQCGLALATHRTLDDGRQHVVWNGKAAVLAGTLQTLHVSAAPELRYELEMIDRAVGWPFENPNGVELIRAVNALQPLGKDQALATLEEYLNLLAQSDRHYDDGKIVFWIIRLLFEPIRVGDRMPYPGLAVAFGYSSEVDTSEWPLDPMGLVGDVPFMLGQQINLGGREESPHEHISWARRHGVIRDEPLRPTMNPLVAAETIIADPTYQRALGIEDEYWRNDAIRDLQLQAMAMVEGLVPSINADPHLDEANYRAQWQDRVEQSVELGIEWDDERQEFVVPEE